MYQPDDDDGIGSRVEGRTKNDYSRSSPKAAFKNLINLPSSLLSQLTHTFGQLVRYQQMINTLRLSIHSVSSSPVYSSRTFSRSVSRVMASSSSPPRQPVSLPPSSMEASIRVKLEDILKPIHLSIRNDSSKHSHHQPMKVPGAYTGETHFFIHAVSAEFNGKTRIARHRLVNNALVDEFARGLHALSLKLETEDESTH